MTQVISLVAHPKAMTPAHSSPMELDEHEGHGAFRIAADTPDSPSPRTVDMARKRAASINTVEANHVRFEHLKLNTPTSMNRDSPRGQMCLCIPRLKSPDLETDAGTLPLWPSTPTQIVFVKTDSMAAFILYRQHHQAQVVAQNPNLSNPEISKIIGEQWKEEPEDIKTNWKGLAEEEKLRHQRLYPDYRYQPRRGSRAQTNRPGSTSADDAGRCPKCNGRTTATPRTPSGTFPTSTVAKQPMNQYHPSLRGDETGLVRRGSSGSMPPARLRHPQRLNPYEVDEYDLESPEMKRRRFNSSGSYHSVSSPGMVPGQATRTPSIGGPPSAMQPYAGTPLPEPGSLTRSKSGPMPPPPRPSISGPWPERIYHGSRNHSFDESLRLPPLQTSVPMSPSVAGEVDIRQMGTPVTGLDISAARDPQARSIEAMVMSIPFTRKLAVLSRISQPLAPPRPGSPGIETRGAIIAVEGPMNRMVQQVGQAVENALSATEDFALKTWANHSTRELQGDGSQSDQYGASSESQSFFTSYFKTMLRWHEKSREIVRHITKPNASESPRRGSAESNSSTESRGKPPSNVPVALLKEGFSLTLSDMFACDTPIADAYAPVDHWQWMATLWRGVVGPDMVVYVKPSVEEEIAKHGSVHVQKRPGLMVVQVPVGSDLDEATERRVAFEVVEWVRGGSYREGFGQA
ncbi:hypothetical protein B0J13DRAFT_654554 [Dactylonectria estremocensis]|uniref:HMG box domain-containing protein n=1 Tax=Dactylonectria estremocensis TaxID=1079267 RepID=A0A9P9F3S4_9HYPO|nr:hypothetical protein B0J13DRAFT_654554 [Dactylonectria estremocensis]